MFQEMTDQHPTGKNPARYAHVAGVTLIMGYRNSGPAPGSRAGRRLNDRRPRNLPTARVRPAGRPRQLSSITARCWSQTGAPQGLTLTGGRIRTRSPVSRRDGQGIPDVLGWCAMSACWATSGSALLIGPVRATVDLGRYLGHEHAACERILAKVLSGTSPSPREAWPDRA